MTTHCASLVVDEIVINLIMEFLDQYETVQNSRVCRQWHEWIRLRQINLASTLMATRLGSNGVRWIERTSSLVSNGYASSGIGFVLAKIQHSYIRHLKLDGKLLRASRLNDEGACSLFNCGGLSNVGEWHLESQNIRKMQFLENYARKAQIRVLNLNDNDIDSLPKLGELVRLEELHLRCNNLNSQHLVMVQISQVQLPNFTRLDLSFNKLTVESIELISNSAALTESLQYLDLSGNYISSPIAILLSSFKNLTQLNLNWMYVHSSDDCVESFSKMIGSMNKMKILNFGSIPIHSKILKTISNSHSMKNLTHLCLFNTRTSLEDVQQLCSSQHVKHLTFLDLSSNSLNAPAAIEIAQSENMRKLTHLNISCNHVGYEGRKAIASSTILNNLQSYYSLEAEYKLECFRVSKSGYGFSRSIE